MSLASQNEAELQKKFRNTDSKVIKYVLNTVAAGNLQIAHETLAALPPEQIPVLLKQITNQKVELTEEQKGLIDQFIAIAGTGSSTARKYLKNNSWNLELAINYFYSNGGVPEPEDFELDEEPSDGNGKNLLLGAAIPVEEPRKVEELFDIYREEDKNLREMKKSIKKADIEATNSSIPKQAADASSDTSSAVTTAESVKKTTTGTSDKKEDEEEESKDPFKDVMQYHALLAFCKQLNINLEKDMELFMIAYLLNATSGSYSFTRDEFIKGFQKLKCETLADIKEQLPKWKESIFTKKKEAINMYRFAFKFASPGRRMRAEKAVHLWKILLPHSQNFDEWCSFVEITNLRTITQDLWNEVYDFLDQMEPGYSNYNEIQDGWNSVIDEFMEKRLKKKEKGLASNATNN